MAIVTYKKCPLCGSENIETHIKAKDFVISKESFNILKCDNCSFVFTQNIPDEQSIGSYYESDNYVSHSNTKEGIVNKAYHIARDYMLGVKRRIIQKYVNAENKNLLDIGTGTGYFINHMQQSGWNVEGVEPSDKARNYSIKKFGVKVHPLTAFDSLEANQYDVISMWHVLEHVHRLDDYARQIRKLLKEDGILVLALPNHTSYDAKHYKSKWAAYDVPKHLWHFSPETVKFLFQKHHFDVVGIHRMPLDAFYVSMLSEEYKNSKFKVIKGAFFGGISYINSLFNKDTCSSLIYVIKKSGKS